MKKLILSIAFTLILSISFTSVKAQYNSTGNIFTINGYTGYFVFTNIVVNPTGMPTGTYYYYYNSNTDVSVGINYTNLDTKITTYRSASGPIDGGLSILLIGGAAYHLKRRKGVKENNENDNSSQLTA
jgi:hypothetical protein